MRDPPKGRGIENMWRKNTIALRTTTVIKSKRDILENYPTQTLPRKNLCASNLSSNCFFFCSLICFSPLGSLSFH